MKCAPSEPVLGNLVSADKARSTVTTLYFDERGSPEWRAIAHDGTKPMPVVAENWVLAGEQ